MFGKAIKALEDCQQPPIDVDALLNTLRVVIEKMRKRKYESLRMFCITMRDKISHLAMA
jgi:hypothetical protein